MPSLEHPKVTCLISTYNRPQYLAEAIESVERQTMGDWELIILNDGGVDVRGVVEKFADPRITYVPDTVNKGAAPRFNQGLALARGDYVCYLGDDDLFYPNHFECLSKALDENPEAGLAYSDLYAAMSVSDHRTGKRFVLDKQMLVSRDFNREFMFHFNHVLHVSLMHRREAALRVGGFDESVKVLIEWSLNRRLAFIYDFVHVEQATGEYHMAVTKSDRISVRERRNQESYKHNLRRIRRNFPEEPWGKIDRVDLLYLVSAWGKKLNSHLKEIIDNFDHPMRITLIGNGAGLTAKAARDSLRELKELKNIDVMHIPQRLDPVIAFRKAARETDAEFLFLVTPQLQAVTAPRRIFVGVELLKNSPDLNSIRWNVPGEEKEKTVFECLIYRDYFLKNTKPSKSRKPMMVPTVTMSVPRGFKFDAMYSDYGKMVQEKNWDKAREMLTKILAERKGFPHIQYLIRDVEDVAYAFNDFALLEEHLLALIERGYTPDNYIRLCRLRKHQGRHREALEAGRKGLEAMGLTDADFESSCFPLNIPTELGVFRMLLNMGEAHLQLNEHAEAAKCYHMAAKMKSGSHKPFLGFAKSYLGAGDTGRASEALARMPGNEGPKDPETHRLLAAVCRQKRDLQLAFNCLLKAFECGPGDPENLEPFFFTGSATGRFQEMVQPLKTFLSHNPEHASGWGRLSSVYFNLGENYLAREAAEKALAADPRSPVAKSIIARIDAGRESTAAAAARLESGENGLTIDTSNVLANLLDTNAIWQ
jgi:glycosyltransferase involved in cell wall biosynthesis/Flp pilus assembly protein TadD